MADSFDFVIFGAGFGGSIMAMVLRRLGFSVLLLERGSHPRFVIGESSTPFANLLLEKLAALYDLPVLREFSEWGRWQRSHPQIACGLKRGFTFYPHQPGQRLDLTDRSRQLLVAASPNDTVADTHWYRPDFDHFLLQQAHALGAVYFDKVRVTHCEHQTLWSLHFDSDQGSHRVTARFAIDASGASGFLAGFLGLVPERFPDFPETQAVFAHFRQVRPLPPAADLSGSAPYPSEDAAVHHLFDDGWIWMLRFNNGLTSAGAAFKSGPNTPHLAPAERWHKILQKFPTLSEQFAASELVTDFYEIPQLSFRRPRAAGPGWALLPSAVGFVDPLLSTGFALNLLGIVRLGEILATSGNLSNVDSLRGYERDTLADLDVAADLISALYARLPSFPEFAGLSLLYFAAMSFAESAWRLRKSQLATHFLLANDLRFSRLRRQLCHQARTGPALEFEKILRAIEPWDIAGLGRPDRRNWHPVRLEDLLAARDKLGASAEEIYAAFPGS